MKIEEIEIEKRWEELLSLTKKVKNSIRKPNSYMERFEDHLFLSKKSNAVVDMEYFHMLMAILKTISPESKELLLEIANVCEKDVDEEEKNCFINLLLTRINYMSQQILETIPERIVKKQEKTNEKTNQELEEEKHFSFTTTKSQKRKPKIIEYSYLQTSKNNNRGVKPKMSGRQKIMAEITKKRPFLIFKPGVYLPNQKIKRIRIKESFDSIISFIQENIILTKGTLSIEDGFAKVMFVQEKKKKIA